MAHKVKYLRKALDSFRMRCFAGKTLGEVKVHHPGLNYTDIPSMCGYPAVWNLQRLVEVIRLYAEHIVPVDCDETFIEYDKFMSDRIMLMASTQLNITKDMYNYNVLRAPLEADIKLNHVGSASLSTTLEASCNNEKLFSNVNSMISIDIKSKTLLPLPEWWVTKYRPYAATDAAFRVIRNPHPEDSFCERTSVRWSDTDYYRHINWTNHIKYCLDAAHVLSEKGSLVKTTQQTLCNNAIKYVEISYIGQSVTGDLLDVFTWESGENQLEFDVMMGNKPICYCKIRFYDTKEFPELT